MGRYSLNLRPVYGRDEPTFGEQLSRGIQFGLDTYEKRREAERGEQNEVLSRGGTRLPDAAPSGIEGAVRRGARGIGDLLGRAIGRRPSLEPTGTFVESRPSEPGRFPMDERLPQTPDPDQIVTDAILRRVVPPAAPQGALPPTPRGSVQGPSIAPNPGLPALNTAGTQNYGERSFDYQGIGNRRYTMPQTGERERTNRMLEYGQQTAIKEGAHTREQEDEIAALTAAGMPANEARARVLTNTVRYDEEYGPQRSHSLTYEERSKLSAEHDQRMAEIRARLARLTGAGRGNSPEAMDLRRRALELNERKFAASGERGAASTETAIGSQEQRAVKPDPYGMLSDEEKAANAVRQRQADETRGRAREHAGNAATIARGANAPSGTPTLQTARAEEARLISAGMTREQARKSMKAKGWPIK